MVSRGGLFHKMAPMTRLGQYFFYSIFLLGNNCKFKNYRIGSREGLC